MPREDRDAVEMLGRCHRQLEQRLAELANLAAAFAHEQATPTTLEELLDVHARFTRSASRHVADEEQSIFPRLPEDMAIVAKLRAEHRGHEHIESQLAAAVHRLRLPCTAAAGHQLSALVAELRAAYSAHIELEERELAPRLRDLLDANNLAAALEEMQGRRGDRDGRRRGRGGGAKKRPR